MGPDEQFFFYASDHGNSNTQAINLPRRVGGRRNDLEDIDLDEGIFDAMQLDPDNQPDITIDYEDVTDASNVFFNGTLVGQLLPGQTEVTLDVPESLISLHNQVEIDNAGAGDITIDTKGLDTGPIGTQIADIPEPGPAAGLAAGLVAFGWFRLRSRRSS
jgi:hypothetical protein